MTARHGAIIREIYKAVERLGGNRELLAVIGSWGDTLRDEERPGPERPSSRLTTRHQTTKLFLIASIMAVADREGL